MSQKLNLPNRNDQYPGPGTYNRFSEFGILDPNYKKRTQTEPSKTKETEDTKNEENQGYEEFHEEKREKSKKESRREKVKEPETKKEEIKQEEAKNEEQNKENPEVNQEAGNASDKDDIPLLKQSLQYAE